VFGHILKHRRITGISSIFQNRTANPLPGSLG
jgi:hypothetical protein